MKRNSAIDYLKFLFSIMIFIYHFGIIFHGGYIVVEGFFMISGYLMFVSLQKKKNQNDLPDGTARFVWNKYKALFLPLLFSAISGFLIQGLLVFPPMTSDRLLEIPRLAFEIFPLQTAGFDGRWTTGVSWYVSAMLIAIALLHPFFKKNPERAAYTICPVLSILLYGIINKTFGHIGVTMAWVAEVFNAGILRAIAGISAGFFLGALLLKAENWQPKLRTKILLTAAEFLGIAALIIATCQEKLAYSAYDLVLTVLQFGIFWIAFSGKAWHTPYFSFKYSKVFSSISLYLFLNHVAWCMYFEKLYPDMTTEQALKVLPKTSLCVAASCVAVWGLSTLTRFVFKKISERKANATAITE